MKRIGFLLPVAILVIALAATACSNAAPAPAAQAPAPAKALPAVKVGISAPFSGPSASFGEYFVNAFTLLLDPINSTAGGRKIELIKDDNQGDPAVGVTVYKRLLTQVDVIVGPLFAGVAKAVWKLPEEAKKPAMNLMYSPVGKTWDTKYTINGGAMTNTVLMKTIADFMVKTKKEDKIAILDSSSAYGAEGLVDLLAALKALKVDPVAKEVFAEGDKDFAGQIAKVKSSGATSVLIDGYPTEMGILVKQMRELLPNIRMYGLSPMMRPDFANGAGLKNIEGIYMAANFLVTDTKPVVKNFRDKFLAKYKIEPTDIAAIGWDTASNLVGILNTMGPVDFSADKFMEAVGKTKVEGVQGTYDFTTDKWDPVGDAVMGLWKDGKLQPAGQ